MGAGTDRGGWGRRETRGEVWVYSARTKARCCARSSGAHGGAVHYRPGVGLRGTQTVVGICTMGIPTFVVPRKSPNPHGAVGASRD